MTGETRNPGATDGDAEAKIVITPRSLSRKGEEQHPALTRIVEAGYTLAFPSPGRQPSEDELIAAMNGCVGYLAGVEPISRRVIAAADRLRVISRNGVGVDNVDLAATEERGIEVKRATGANSRGVAELAFGHILAAARIIPATDAALKAGGWEREKGIELEGRVLGLVGCGSVGRTVARLALGFGMKVLAFDPYPTTDFSPGDGFSWTGFENVVSSSDVISLHCPPDPDRWVIGQKEIGRMKRGVIIVNTARDGLVDPDAILNALETETVRAFTVDAFASEPPEDRRLISHPRVIATAHIGGFTAESVDRATEIAVDNLLDALDRSPETN
jgi:D-3-phosphoglycerate dehydrogenase / 2-oxoglutarate reductase